jgi:FixJ family two-component response regulator
MGVEKKRKGTFPGRWRTGYEAAEVRRCYESLTKREREVMKLIVSGLLNKQIAAELGSSETTVKMHRGQIMYKMKAQSVVELARMAEKIGITSEASPGERVNS